MKKAQLTDLYLLFTQVKPSESCAWMPERTQNDAEESSADSATSSTRASSPDEPLSTSSRVRVRTHSPTATEMMQPRPKPLITYSRADRKRVHAERARAAALAHTRRSQRLLLVNADVLRAETIIADGHTLVPWVDK
jgi:hypothetical protein